MVSISAPDLGRVWLRQCQSQYSESLGNLGHAAPASSEEKTTSAPDFLLAVPITSHPTSCHSGLTLRHTLLKSPDTPGACHAMWLQACPTLWSPMDCSLPGSSVHGISRQDYWSGLPFTSPENLPDGWIEPMSFMSPALAGGFFTTSTTWEVPDTPGLICNQVTTS